MFNENIIKQVFAGILVAILLVFTYLIIKPIFFAMIFGFILSYIFSPINKRLLLRIRNPTVTALITCLFVLTVLVAVIWTFMPILTKQLIEGYTLLQTFDLVGILKKIFPFLFLSEKSIEDFATAYNTLISGFVYSAIGNISSIVLNFPSVMLKILVVLISFFYGLRDGDKIISILKDTLPFDRSTTTRFIIKSKLVTDSIIYGRIVIGVVVGILTGIGFYLFGIKGALVLTLLAMLASILPIIGPWAIWVPVVITLFVIGQQTTAILLTIYCLIFVALFENIAYPLVISRKSQLPTSLTLIGLIGGMLVFGLFGIVLGPLIIAYLSILFEIYHESHIKKLKDETKS